MRRIGPEMDSDRAFYIPYVYGHSLVCDVPHSMSNLIRCTFIMLDFRQRETLRNGRFRKWHDDKLEHRVSLAWDRETVFSSNNLLEKYVDWIGNAARHPWTMRARAASDKHNPFPIEFQFSDMGEAVLFALRWKGET